MNGKRAAIAILFVGVPTEEVTRRISDLNRTILPKICTELGIWSTLFPVEEKGFSEFNYDMQGLKFSGKILPSSKPSKGFLIYNFIKSMASLQSPPNYLVFCDGTGRIPFENLYRILSFLSEKPVECVITKRNPWRGGIHPVRQKIEEFESWLVSDRFKIPVVYDLQCGLWGYDFDACSDLRFGANGYEVELNFAVESMRCKKSIGEMTVDISPSTTPSSFDDRFDEASAHFQKAYYLSKYFGLRKEEFIERANYYDSSYAAEERRLPQEYLAMLEKLEELPTAPNIIELENSSR